MNVLKRIWLLSPWSRPPWLDRLDKAVWYARFVRWCRSHPCPVSASRRAVYEETVRLERLTGPVTYLEFGTFEGESIGWWLSVNRDPRSRFFGFDSFEGLPEPWRGYERGHFATEPPRLDDPRCRIVAGYFQRTLPEFLATHRPVGRQIVFMDADLFSSTEFVLQHMGPHLRAGDLLMFDEFHAWLHEFRAFANLLAVFPLQYEVLRRSADWSQVVLKIASSGCAIGQED